MVRRFGVRMAAPVGWVLGCGCLFSCDAIFGIEDSDRRNESELAGAGGNSGSSGDSTGGRSTGGRSSGGGASGGRAGQGGEGGSGAVGNQPGTGGEAPGGDGGGGGDGGDEDRGAILGEPCTGDETESNTACTIASPHLVLECESGVWKVGTTCPGDEACIPEKGVEEPA